MKYVPIYVLAVVCAGLGYLAGMGRGKTNAEEQHEDCFSRIVRTYNSDDLATRLGQACAATGGTIGWFMAIDGSYSAPFCKDGSPNPDTKSLKLAYDCVQTLETLRAKGLIRGMDPAPQNECSNDGINWVRPCTDPRGFRDARPVKP